jgi:thiamine pyrophosphokinase
LLIPVNVNVYALLLMHKNVGRAEMETSERTKRISICHIVGAGRFDEAELFRNEQDYVIAADGGYSHLEKLGIKPDLLLGDFDSLEHLPDFGNIIRLPMEKDDTDMFSAVKTGLSLGYRTFVLYGGVGGRLDHTLANIQTVAYLSTVGAAGYLVGEGRIITAVTDSELFFDGEQSGIISVFCHGSEAQGVDLKGLKYPLKDALLTSTMPLGVSNEFTGKPSSVSVKKGTLIVIWSDGAHKLLLDKRFTSCYACKNL